MQRTEKFEYLFERTIHFIGSKKATLYTANGTGWVWVFTPSSCSSAGKRLRASVYLLDGGDCFCLTGTFWGFSVTMQVEHSPRAQHSKRSSRDALPTTERAQKTFLLRSRRTRTRVRRPGVTLMPMQADLGVVRAAKGRSHNRALTGLVAERRDVLMNKSILLIPS